MTHAEVSFAQTSPPSSDIQSIEIQAGKMGQTQFDTPASINVIEASTLSGSGPQEPSSWRDGLVAQ
jgi:hypothetical protein